MTATKLYRNWNRIDFENRNLVPAEEFHMHHKGIQRQWISDAIFVYYTWYL